MGVVRSRRSPVRLAVRALLTGLLAAGLAGLVIVPASAQAVRRAAPPATASPGLYDLDRDERLGGHTLARHVGRTDQELIERLRRETNISAASTWPDALTARRVVALAVNQSQRRIDEWTRRRGGRPNLVLHYQQRDGPPIGRSMFRGEQVSRPCDRALVVLRWLEREQQWIVLTSYPETRR